ncbi:MAG: GNAT family N-acetyltransferase [Candidatus Paceibacterota bacterium]
MIRKAKIKDLSEIMDVIRDVNEKAQQESKEIIVKRISEEQLLCYELDQKIIGFLGWDNKYKEDFDNWYLEQITVHKDYRGQGVGKKFILYFLDFCRKNGVKKVYGNVQEHNERSLKMFLNTGWIINKEKDKNTKNEITIEFDLR